MTSRPIDAPDHDEPERPPVDLPDWYAGEVDEPDDDRISTRACIAICLFWCVVVWGLGVAALFGAGVISR